MQRGVRDEGGADELGRQAKLTAETARQAIDCRGGSVGGEVIALLGLFGVEVHCLSFSSARLCAPTQAGFLLSGLGGSRLRRKSLDLDARQLPQPLFRVVFSNDGPAANFLGTETTRPDFLEGFGAAVAVPFAEIFDAHSPPLRRGLPLSFRRNPLGRH